MRESKFLTAVSYMIYVLSGIALIGLAMYVFMLDKKSFEYIFKASALLLFGVTIIIFVIVSGIKKMKKR